MARFHVGLYALYVETYMVEADSLQQAYELTGEDTGAKPAAVDKLFEVAEEGMTRDEFPDEADWTRLFDGFTAPCNRLDALRTVKNCDTGERWDGYWPPVNVEGERKIGRYEEPYVNVNRLQAVEETVRAYRASACARRPWTNAIQAGQPTWSVHCARAGSAGTNSGFCSRTRGEATVSQVKLEPLRGTPEDVERAFAIRLACCRQCAWQIDAIGEQGISDAEKAKTNK